MRNKILVEQGSEKNEEEFFLYIIITYCHTIINNSITLNKLLKLYYLDKPQKVKLIRFLIRCQEYDIFINR